MASNLFERLAELEVPPPPDQFDAQLHDKVNRSLLGAHLLDLALGALPWAVGHFARALVGLVLFTLTGRYESKDRRRRS